MADVMILGGGLSGLAAANELEQHGIDYSLIEVKRQLGGGLGSVRQDGFLLDAGTMALADTLDKDWLDSLDLDDALYPLNGDSVAFKGGAGMLIDALQRRLSGARLMRMAVSSIGDLDDGRYAVCLENGLMLEARVLIIAIPARYAERLFYGYITPLTEALLDYHYDTIQRVSLGFRTDEIPNHIENLPDMAYAFIHRTDYPARVPDGHTLLQFGLRIAPERLETTQQAVDLLLDVFNLPQPVTQFMSYWPESDPVSCYADEHQEWVRSLHEKLPERVTLIGSDYGLEPPARKGVIRLDERIKQGREAAEKIIKLL